MSHRSYTVSRDHYASRWKVTGELNDRKAINLLAITYATMPDGPAREAVYLELIRAFDPYLKKYGNMVISGHLPGQQSAAGRDAVQFLKTLLPKGRPATATNLLAACRTLHLAFKQQTTDDVYDVMALCFLRTVARYDPFYTDKVRQVCEVIHGRFARRKQFTAEAISRAVGFDALGCLRLLVRRRFLASVHGPKKKVVGYTRGAGWPPPDGFFEAGPVGFVYFAQLWFRYYLNDHITQVMGELETQDGVLQLEHSYSHKPTAHPVGDRLLPSANGGFIDHDGTAWAADMSLVDAQFDISTMTDAWVKETADKLFRNLTPEERKILQLVFRDEQTWVEIGRTLQVTADWVKERFDEILIYLQGRSGAADRHPARPSHTVDCTCDACDAWRCLTLDLDPEAELLIH